MPAQIPLKRIKDILPRRYRYSPLVRALLLGFAVLVLGYTLFFLFKYVQADTPLFFKIMPLLIVFVSINSVLKHLTSLNCVLFQQDSVSFSYLAKRKVTIPFEAILSIEFEKRITYYMKIVYQDCDGKEKTFVTPASFPKFVEILVNIADLAPHPKLSGVLQKAVDNLRSDKDIYA